MDREEKMKLKKDLMKKSRETIIFAVKLLNDYGLKLNKDIEFRYTKDDIRCFIHFPDWDCFLREICFENIDTGLKFTLNVDSKLFDLVETVKAFCKINLGE